MSDEAKDPAERDRTSHLARAARRGEEGRFAELYERIAPAVHAWASLRIRPEMRGYVDPEDIVAEVWCRAWKAFPKFDAENASFRPWVFKIAKNVMLEAFRKHQRAAPGSAAAGSSTRVLQLQNLPDSATEVSRKIARHEGLQALLEWVQGLEEEEQKLFLHCGLEGMGYAEVAERMQLQYDTVAKRWQKLRERVGQFAAPRDLLVA